jgi:histidyl-tRNA synthetase
MSGVGISFEIVFIVVEELNLPETVTATSKALFINYGDGKPLCHATFQQLRAGIKKWNCIR